MSGALLAFVANDNVIELSRLRDAADAYINTATVLCTGIIEVGGGALAGSFPITMSYVSSSNGTYRGTLEDTLALVDGVSYEATVTVSGSGIPDATFAVPFVARRRTTR